MHVSFAQSSTNAQEDFLVKDEYFYDGTSGVWESIQRIESLDPQWELEKKKK